MLKHAVVVITYKRPDYLRSCLSALGALNRRPEQVIVVDQSPDDVSCDVTGEFAFATWMDNRGNAGRMTTSRNRGLEMVRSEIVSFIDDDSEPAADWAESLLEVFDRHPTCAAVGGRVDNGQAGEESWPGVVGSVSRWGRVDGNFGAMRESDMLVEHGVGANMSFRTSVTVELGGFRDDFPGTAMAEDTDMFLRIGRLGHDVRYAPQSVVRHTSAPHVVGARFDGRYSLYAAANYLLLMRRNYGVASTQFCGRLAAPIEALVEHRSIRGRVFRSACASLGVLLGIMNCLRLDGVRRPPLRAGSVAARRIRASHARP